MIKAWRGLGEFRGDSSTRTWILRIAHHTAIDVVGDVEIVRSQPEDLPDHSASGAEAADPATRATARDELGALGAALAELDDLSARSWSYERSRASPTRRSHERSTSPPQW